MWNLDLTTAPRDGSQILMATSKGERVITKWLQPTKHTPSGRFDGFPENANSPMAWCELPLHPHHMPPADLLPVSADAITIIEDVGGAEHE